MPNPLLTGDLSRASIKSLGDVVSVPLRLLPSVFVSIPFCGSRLIGKVRNPPFLLRWWYRISASPWSWPSFLLHLHRLWFPPYLCSEEVILSSDLVGNTEWAILSVTFKTFIFGIVWSPHLCVLTHKRLHTLLHLETTGSIHHQEEHPLLSMFTPLPFWNQRLVNTTLDREHWRAWPRVPAPSASKDFPLSIPHQRCLFQRRANHYESAPKGQPFQWRTREAKVIFKDNNNSDL